MKPLPPAIAAIQARLAPLGPATVRRMFGGWGVFMEGMMFALIADDRLYLKADDENRDRFAAAGMAPFTYLRKGSPATLSYYGVSDNWLAEPPEVLLSHAEQAIAAARRSKAAKPKRKHGA